MRKITCERCGRERQLYHRCVHCPDGAQQKPAIEGPHLTDEAYRWDKRPGRDDPIRLADVIGTTLAASVMPGYEPLAMTLQSALDQAQAGKGKERHANGRTFDRQPIMEIGRMVGLGYPTGQAQKKTQEAVGMAARGQTDRAVAELLGAINYLAAAILLVREA